MSNFNWLYFSKETGFAIQTGNKESNPLTLYTEQGDKVSENEETCISFSRFMDEQKRNEDSHRLNQRELKEKAEGDKLFQKGAVSAKGSAKTCKLIISSTIEETVSFTGEYYRNCSTSCNCKGSFCRHRWAAYLFLKEKQNRLKKAYLATLKPEDKVPFLPDELEEIFDKDWSNRQATYENMKEIRTVLASVKERGSLYFTAAFLGYFLGRDNEYFWSGYRAEFTEENAVLLGSICLEPEIYDVVENPEAEETINSYYSWRFRDNLFVLKKIKKMIQTEQKALEKGKYASDWFKEFILKYTENDTGLLRYYLLQTEDFQEQELSYMEKMSSDAFLSLQDVEKEKMLLKLDKITRFFSKTGSLLLNRYLDTYETEKRVCALSKLKYYSLTLGNYKQYSEKDQILLASLTPAEEGTVAYVLQHVMTKAAPSEVADYLFKVTRKALLLKSDKALPEATVQLLREKAEELPHHGLLLPWVEWNLSDWTKQKKLYRNGITITAEDVTSYFQSTYRIEAEEDTFRIVYKVYEDSTEAPVASILEEMSGRVEPGDKLEEKFSRESVEIFRKTCILGREEQFRREKQDAFDRISLRNFEVNHKNFMYGYRELCQGAQEEKVVFADSFKAKIEYLFIFTEKGPYLGFKVGNVKSYVVKNARDFLEYFRIQETVKYGKDLILTHDIQNLQEEDRPVISILSSMDYPATPYDSELKRYIPVGGPLFSNLMRMLKGRTVMADDLLCEIRLEPVSVRICMDSAYTLSLSIDREKQKLIVTDKTAYLLTDNNGHAVIDRVSGSKEEVQLLSFSEENAGISVKPILHDFKKNLYARFSELFSLDDKIKEDFKLSLIKISAYFDYQNKAVTVRTEYQKDGRKLKREQIAEQLDFSKLTAFDNLLKGIGFEDNILSDEGKILNFLKMDFSELKKMANVYLSESLNNKKLVSVNRQVIRITRSKSGIIEAMLEESEFSEKELEEILKALQRKRKFILLSGDRIVDLDSQEAKEFGETVQDLNLEVGHLYKKKRIEMVGVLKAFAHENNCSVDKQLRNTVEEIRNFKNYEVQLPALNATLRGYQDEGFRWLSVLSKNNLGGILADDMGLGKTLQMIALLKSDPAGMPSLIVCPKSLVFNWVHEFAKFDGETEVVEVYGLPGKRAKTIQEINNEKKTVYVTSYDSLRNDISLYEQTFNYCILDEAQFIKNVTAQKSKSVKEIKAKHRFALTGTPIENNIIDLWSIFDFIMPGYFEDLSEFRTQAQQEDFHERVARRIGPFVLRRIKENVLQDLPQKYERILSCEMTSGQKKLYEALRKKAKDMLNGGEKAFDLLPMLTEMRQVCVDPQMCMENYQGGSGKVQLLEEMIPAYIKEGHRMLIFSQFVKGLSQIEKLLEEQSIPYFLLTGQTAAAERTRLIDEFNSTTGTDVFLISLKAGGTGLNLTGADTVIHLDPWWNVAAENQATDRAHRIGQTKNVEVIKLISEDSIEQRVIELQNIKKDLFDKVISKDESSVTSASLEDIAYILD